MTDSETDALISEATKGFAGEDTRRVRTDPLPVMLQGGNSPASGFHEQWRSDPNVMFEPGDPQSERFAWGERQWTTERAYDEELGKLLGELACGPDVAEAQIRGLVRRALGPARPQEGESDRLWPRLFAARVIATDCPPAAGLPDNMRRRLEELAAQADAAVAPTRAATPNPVE